MILMKNSQLTKWASALAFILSAHLALATAHNISQLKNVLMNRKRGPPDGIGVPDNLNPTNQEYSWTQKYNFQRVLVKCRAPTAFNNQFQFYQDFINKASTLRGVAGNEYITAPLFDFDIHEKRCFVLLDNCPLSLTVYSGYISPAKKTELFPRLFKQLIQGVNYVHQLGWANLNFDLNSICIKLNPEPTMMIYLDRIKSLKPLQYNTDQTVIPKPAYDPFLLYPNEWVSQNLVDPRKADLWNIGEIFYYAFFSNIKYYEGLEEAKQMVDHTFSSIKMPRPTSSVNLQEAFKTFLPKFKYFIKHQLNDSLNSLNSNSKSSSDLAILLNLHGGFPQQLITTRPQTPFNEIVLSQSIINLLKTSLGIIYHDDHFKHYTQFILNGFYRLGIIGAVTLDYTQHSKMYAPALKMISQLLVWYPQQRPTPEDYIKQWISRETAQATS